jgi:hypothetical protein
MLECARFDIKELHMFASLAAPLSRVAQEQSDAVAIGTLLFMSVLYFAFIIALIAATWKIFTKAGQPGWASIVPFYGNIVLLRLTGRPGWWLLLLLIPFVNIIVGIIHYVEIAKSFGKGTGFTLGLIFLTPIFWPILGFGSSCYIGPAVQQGMPTPVAA